MERIPYDEFGLFHENASEHGLPYVGRPSVRRVDTELPDGRLVSSLVWGDAAPDVVFVHGGAQNAHTWDTTIMALGCGALAVDLPGHGHSSWRADSTYPPASLADDVACAVTALAPQARLVVGMSLGGLTVMELAVRHPALVASLVMIDVTPGVNRAKAKAIIDFVNGPQRFDSFEALLARTVEHNPTRSESSLRRGILHNARQLDDGSWVWRYDRGEHRAIPSGPATDVPLDEGPSPLWDDFARIACPLAIVRGSLSPVVDDDDRAEALRLQPTLTWFEVAGAGHSVQGDRPLELAGILATR